MEAHDYFCNGKNCTALLPDHCLLVKGPVCYLSLSPSLDKDEVSPLPTSHYPSPPWTPPIGLEDRVYLREARLVIR